MTVENTIATHRRCPTCGYSGNEEICPFDGTALTLVQQLSPGASDTTLTETDPRSHARDHLDEDTMRSPDFGQWESPKVSGSHRNLVGQTIGERYVVESILGQGGMGTVYAAHQKSVDRSVAIKVLNREFSENDQMTRRFHQEALAASRLSHAHTISIYDFGQTGHLLYIVMEHLRGRTLKDLLQVEGHLSLDRSVHIIRQVLQSIAEAHAKGIIHRDLKPENIFLTESVEDKDFVKVLDFGVAKLKPADGGQGTLTQMGLIFGTPKYMAPEQSSHVGVDARADLYAVGVMLYEMLMGSPPFQGENPLSVILAHSKERVERFKERRPDLDVSEVAEAITLKLLSKEPDLRYASAIELNHELANLLDALKDGPSSQSTTQFPKVEDLQGYQSVASLELSLTDERYDVPTPPVPRTGVLWALAVLTLITAAAVWMTGTDSESSESADANGASVSEPMAVAEDTPEAQNESPQLSPMDKTIHVSVSPEGATLYDHARQEKLGDAPWSGRLKEKTVLRAEKKGYASALVDIDPNHSKTAYAVTLNKLKSSVRKKRKSRVGRTAPPSSKTPPPTPVAQPIKPQRPKRPIRLGPPKAAGISDHD